MRMARSLKENGHQVKKKVEEYSSKQIIHHTQENGQTIPNTVTVNRNGQMEQNTKAIFNLVRKRDMAY